MLNSWPIALLISALLGILAGLGVGGGSLLILWLTVVLDVPYPEARITNLLFFLPGAFLATALRIKERAIPINRIWPCILTGCIGAILAFYIGKQIDLFVLKKIFGGLLLVTGIRELFYRPRNAR